MSSMRKVAEKGSFAGWQRALFGWSEVFFGQEQVVQHLDQKGRREQGWDRVGRHDALRPVGGQQQVVS